MIPSPWGPLPWWLVYTPVVLFGLALGSFANVLIYRLPRGESMVQPPSHCPSCGRLIGAIENIPVLSWLFLGARCRTCKTLISVRYPLIELSGALLAVLAVKIWGLSYASFAHGMLFIALLALVIIDLEAWLLPFAITLPLTIIGLIGSALFHLRPLADSLLGLVTGAAALGGIGVLGNLLFRRRADTADDAEDEDSSEDSDRELILPHVITIGTLILLVAGAFFVRLNRSEGGGLFLLLAAVPFFLIWALYRFVFSATGRTSAPDAIAFGKASDDIKEELKDAGAMGGGDIVFGMMAGVFLGWKLTLLMTFMASLLGTFMAVLLIITGINIKNLKIQFGPLLAVSALICLLVGDGIVHWYVSFLNR
jgi:leader peptidase (prepilin peptidase) / N-methyltransferase